MEIEAFIHNFAVQFDDTDESVFTMNTKIKELDEWSSLMVLSVLNMVEKQYGITLTFDELRKSNTIQDLYDILKSKL